MLLLLAACADRCVTPGGAAAPLEAFGDGTDEVIRAFPWQGGERVVWRDGVAIRARDFDAEGTWLGGTYFLDIDGLTLLDVVQTSDGLAIFGADPDQPGEIRVERFASDGTPVGSSLADTRRYSEVAAARVVSTEHGFGVAAYVSQLNIFATLDAEGETVEALTLERSPVTDARLAWNGARFAVAWGGEGDSPLLGLRQRDGVQAGVVTPLLGGWAGVAADPVWTGEAWVVVAGLGSTVTGRPGGAVLLNVIAPNGERTRWDTLVGDLDAPVDALAFARDGEAGAVVWLAGGTVSAVALDAALEAEGCVVSAAGAGALVDAGYQDGQLTAWLASGTEMWRWTADLAP